MPRLALVESTVMSQADGPGAYIGQSLARVEDADLLCGRGRFGDDLPVRLGTLHAAILRSPHAHAELLSIDAEAATGIPGVTTIVTGDDARRWTHPFTAAVKMPVEHWCLAIDRVRYVGEPVAVVLARDRYTAADAAERIEVSYRPLPAVIDPVSATDTSATVLHLALGCNVVSDCSFRYGDPETAFASAAHPITFTTAYPRNSGTPIEGFVVIAEYLPGEGVYEVTANFQGPLAMHPVMAMALGVPANRLHLKMPPGSGGSFGVKHAVFPYIVLMAIAARKAGQPVKWTEHLLAATSATDRVTTLSAAVGDDGVVTALDWDQLEGCGAYLRAPEPATLYRMHGNMTGACRMSHLRIRNRVVLTNKTPSGLVRGFGGPQVYFVRTRKADATDRRDARPRSARGDPPQSRRSFSLSLPGRGRVRFRRLSSWRRSGDRGWRARRVAPPPQRGAERGPGLRDRLRRSSRALDLQHGLHHDCPDPDGASGRRSQERCAGRRDCGARPARRRLGHHRFLAAGAGAPHRHRPGRRRCVRPEPDRSGSKLLSTLAKTPGRSPQAIIRAASPGRSPGRLILRHCASRTNLPALPQRN